MSSSVEGRSARPSSSFWHWVIDPTTERGPLLPIEALRAALGVFFLLAFYGLAAGFFQGDRQLLVSALKFPLVVTASLLLCIPSLFVFAVLAGAQLTVRSYLTAVLGFAGRLGLIAAALTPVVWLFSVSTRYLFIAIWMHVLHWIFALGLARRAFGSPSLAWKGGRAAVSLWLVLLFFVSLQVATVSRPLLIRGEHDALFETEKVFFLEHFGRVAGKEAP